MFIRLKHRARDFNLNLHVINFSMAQNLNRIISICFVLVSIFSLNQSSAQTNGSVEGQLKDTMNVRPIAFASISLIRKNDSILVKSTRTNQQGQFLFNNLKYGSYLILASHNQFIDYVDEFELSETNTKVNFKTIPMTQRGQLLRDVVIKNMAGIKIKGDTLEYLADSFKVKQGAMVEDLLKVLPGIQVNKKGEITAMGEKVEKVLVDGEEFFGDDPTVATQNIRSTVVDKVQVFDRKSDQAQFTGFDDGQEEKTINLKLKKNMNKGVFGKVELGAGPDDRWQNQVMVNSFRNKRQLSAYGLMSSNGKTGLGWDDRNKFADDGNSPNFMSDEGFSWNFTDNDGDNIDWGGRRNEGITKTWTGGARYANKLNENKHHVNFNYSFGRINVEKSEHSFTENILPNRTFNTIDTSTSFTSRDQHRVSGRYEFNPDTITNIIYYVNARISDNISETYNKTVNKSAEDDPINGSLRNNTNNSKTQRINNRLTINRKLKKYGRTLSLATNYTYTDNDAEGFLTGDNNFAALGLNQVLDQKNVQSQLRNYINSDLTYTEPLTKKIQLKASYGIMYDASRTLRNTLVRDNGYLEYNNRIDSLSNDFDSKITGHTVGAEFKYNQKKYSVTAGTRVRYSIFHQQDLVRNLNYDYTRINLFPTLRLNYKFSQYSRLNAVYSGFTNQPTPQQLQPVQDNSNPLDIYIGNPDLKLGYTQQLNLNYFNYQVLTGRSVYGGLFLNNYFNNIALDRTIDPLGRTLNKYVNLKGGYSANGYGGYQSKIPKSDFIGKVNLNGSYNQTPTIINSVEGQNTFYSVGVTPGFTYNKEDLININADLGVTYNSSKNSLFAGRNIQFFSVQPNGSINYYPTKRTEISTEFEYQYNPPIGPFATPFNRFVWDAYVSYKMLKNNNLEWRLSAFDILNQNKGYERNSNINYNTERTFMTLSRYFMLSMIWNFNTGPMAAQNSGGAPRPPRGMRGGGMRMQRR